MQSVFVTYEMYEAERNARLVAEAAVLRNEVSDLVEKNVALTDIVKLLSEKIDQLELENSKLKKTSSNSNKPPSTDTNKKNNGVSERLFWFTYISRYSRLGEQRSCTEACAIRKLCKRTTNKQRCSTL